MRTIKAKMTGPPQPRTDGAGIDHDMWVAWVDAEENDINVAHASCPIPLDRFAELFESGLTNGERVALYKALIIEFYGAGVTPLRPPRRPAGLDPLSAWDAYLDEQDAYDTELALRTSLSNIQAAAAGAWIEGLGSFEGWPFSFVLQAGS